MPYDPAQHHRHSIRLPGRDYSQHGAYFVTICTERRTCLFGEIKDERVWLNAWGRTVQECWEEIPKHYSQARPEEFIVMPNHVHGILWLENETAGSAPPPETVGTIIGSFKSAVTRRINQATGNAGGIVWQRNYFEHVIRDDEAFGAIQDYIRTNPERWLADTENPDGDGTDNVETWVADLNRLLQEHRKWSERRRPRPVPASSPVGATHASPSVPVGAGHAPPLREPSQGEACLAPTIAQVTEGGACPAPTRIGHGYDVHRIQRGGKLILAGVTVSEEISPIAHSDGDVVIHAVVDALLGAMGMGDIGEMFPNSDPRWKGAASRVFLEAAYARVRQAGYHLVNLDATILAERPKLKPFKAQMTETLRQMLGGQINVKAGTNEGCDAIGRGEAIACHAVVLLAKND